MEIANRRRFTPGGFLGGFYTAHWRIPDFFLISDEDLSEDGFIESPPFWFTDCSWRLRAYPKGRGGSGFLVLILRMENPNAASKTLRIRYIIMTSVGKTVEHTSDSKVTFEKRALQFGWNCVRLDELEEIKSRLVTSSALTIIFCMEHPLAVVREVDSGPKILMDLETLSSDLEDFLSNDRKYDVTINVQGREFRAHRALLGARSPVFRAMFGRDTTEAETGVLTIPDSDPETFCLFLSFLYTGKLHMVSFSSAYHLYVTADKYDVQQLKSLCANYLRLNLVPENVCDVAVLAERFGDDILQSWNQDFFNGNWFQVVLTSQWKAMLKDEPRIIDMFLSNMASAANKRTPYKIGTIA